MSQPIGLATEGTDKNIQLRKLQILNHRNVLYTSQKKIFHSEKVGIQTNKTHFFYNFHNTTERGKKNFCVFFGILF